MFKYIKNFRHSLVSKLIVTVGITMLLGISIWAYFSIKYQKEKIMESAVLGADRLSTTIKLGTHYAMMLNSRDDINQIIQNIGKQKEIENIRIYNKEGEIKFSNKTSEFNERTKIKAEACDICHRSEPPIVNLSLDERIRIFNSKKGYRLLGIISPIHNEPGCSTGCHVHPEDKKILGALDLVVSLEESDQEIYNFEKGIIALNIFVFLLTSTIIFIFVLRFVNRPIKRLIEGTRLIGRGDYSSQIIVDQEDDMGQLAIAISKMGSEISEKQAELNRQRDEYQNLFELVPCFITVQDRNYKLLKYNREFSETFGPEPEDYCYHAYKGRNKKCDVCPVEKTFLTGRSYFSEETGVHKDGTPAHWFVKSSPIKNAKGEIVAAMEISLDITSRKKLEEKLKLSEKKYHDIFRNIPNPVFVLDADTLEILDCNDRVEDVYGYSKDEMINSSFLNLFKEEEKDQYETRLKASAVINRAKCMNKDGRTLFVSVRISVSEFEEQKVLLVTTPDITKRLETEQQLIQAGKMATLGEMSTGVAHELNQPLSVIKTASSFFMKKIRKGEPIKDDILLSLSEEIDSHVDRAAKIINHMREFGRKSDIKLVKVQVNDVFKRSFEMFSQQLRVRGIDVVWDIKEDIPMIMANPDRLEQVFINLLVNARDAIEEKWKSKVHKNDIEKITLKTRSEEKKVIAEVCDTGPGIPKAISDKIFEPFFTTKEVGEGTGLGLSISYGILKECGGNIKVASSNAEGTCFAITFPIPDEEKFEG
ncbi:MAG: PAS domain-containing sensor histidine kinase [Desulfobacteraceae bacterium 4572_187]|nr:MAG: PAS domain-containing sensor histidine kinase [Desulfobacteraceae bacterium 4572_187]